MASIITEGKQENVDYLIMIKINWNLNRNNKNTQRWADHRWDGEEVEQQLRWAATSWNGNEPNSNENEREEKNPGKILVT